jgi:integrase
MKPSKTPTPDPEAAEQLKKWTGIAPLERFVFPPGLDGRNGKYRCEEPCRVTAQTDLEAIEQWIHHDTESLATIKGRRSAAEKLLNWSVFQMKKPVSSLERYELDEFARFLSAPIPYATWVTRLSPERSSSDWRPFRGPLSIPSLYATMAHVASLASWMRLQRYADLLVGSYRDDRNYRIAGSASKAQRSQVRESAEPITLDEWVWVRRAMAEMDERPDGLRCRLVVELLYYGGLFVQELIELDQADVEQPSRVCPCWYLNVCGRSNARGGSMFFLPPPLAQTLEAWLKAKQKTVGRRLFVELGLSKDGASLVGCTADEALRHARAVLRLASRKALDAGKTSVGRLLQERTVPSFRLAFERHCRRAPEDYQAWKLTSNLGYQTDLLGAMNLTYKRRSLWDWSLAEHLWAPLP